MIFICITTLLALAIASYTDYKTTEIPLWLFPSVTIIHLVYFIFKDASLTSHIIALLMAAFFFFIYALFFGGGGGDILMAASIGFAFGIRYFLWILLLTYFSFLLFILIKKPERKAEIPFAPFMFFGTFIASILIALI